jgi:ABC-type uncharacterized transport system substrate-binding protein
MHTAFVQRLHELGWIDGRTVVIQYRWAEGRTERSAELAAELVRLKVDVIVTGGNAALAAKQASSVRLAIMFNAGYPSGVQEMAEVETAARRLGLDPVRFEIRRAEDIAPAFESLKDHADALYVVGDALVFTHRVRITTLTLIARLPTIYFVREYVEAGGLMSFTRPIRASRQFGRQDFAWCEAG